MPDLEGVSQNITATSEKSECESSRGPGYNLNHIRFGCYCLVPFDIINGAHTVCCGDGGTDAFNFLSIANDTILSHIKSM